MENTIENAREYLLGRITTESDQEDVAGVLYRYAFETSAPKDHRITELEKENTDLRRQLSDCKSRLARSRVGISPDRP